MVKPRMLVSAALGVAILGLGIGGAIAGAPQVVGKIWPAAQPKGQYGKLDALPDWGGVWFGIGGGPTASASRPEFKGKYLARQLELRRISDANNGELPIEQSPCTPPGMPGTMGGGQYPMEFLFTPGRVTTLHEAWTQERRIYTDGRPHPTGDDLEASFYGHSIGHWEGDTLVIDTIGMKMSTSISTGIGHSDQLRIAERIHLDRANPDILIDEMIVTDPQALEKPWVRELRYRRARDFELLEFICAENNRNDVGKDGKVTFD